MVGVRTLDAMVSDIRAQWSQAAITFVKIDVEGMEIDVLRGAAQLLREAPPQLSVELASDSALKAACSELCLTYQTIRTRLDRDYYAYARRARSQPEHTGDSHAA